MGGQVIPAFSGSRVATRLLGERCHGVLCYVRAIQSTPARVKRLDKSAQRGQCGGHDGVIGLDIQPDERQNSLDRCKMWCGVGPGYCSGNMKASCNRHQKSRAKCQQYLEFVGALGVDVPEYPDRHGKDDEFKKRVSDSNADPSTRLKHGEQVSHCLVLSGLTKFLQVLRYKVPGLWFPHLVPSRLAATTIQAMQMPLRA